MGSKQPLLVLSGFVASAEAWRDFSADWRSSLVKDNELVYFKMAEAMSLRGQFSKDRGWNADRRDAKLIEFAETIRRHVSFQVCAYISRADFNETILQLAATDYRTLANDDPYLVLWYKLVSELILIGPQLGILEPIDFIFDQQQGFQTDIDQTWNMIERNLSDQPPWNKLIGTRPSFRDEKQFMPLQAADMLAWLNRRTLDQSSSEYRGPVEVLEILEPITPLTIRVTREWLQRWFHIMDVSSQRMLARDPTANLKFWDASLTPRQRKTRRRRKRPE